MNDVAVMTRPETVDASRGCSGLTTAEITNQDGE